jgi:hypothetical protein
LQYGEGNVMNKEGGELMGLTRTTTMSFVNSQPPFRPPMIVVHALFNKNIFPQVIWLNNNN